ncbi:MFS transporter [Streptomyces polyrhachis]|uniref:MFS transporter n=1 Tax=Streptomyces polyrhachis TaxID=1282885 RepID=A0ABW2GPH0_9ACTN
MTTAMGAALRRIQTGNALSAFGNGFTVPYTFLYVSQVRGLGSTTAGIALAGFAVAALLVLPFTGRFIDQRGPLPVAIAGALAASAGSMALGLASTTQLVLVSALVMGAGIAVIQPALATMIVWSSAPTNRSRAFATQFFLNNLGLGIGGLVGGLLVDEHVPASFTLLFAIESVMFLVLAGVVFSVRLPHVPRVGDAVPKGARGSLRTMVGDRAMVLLCVLGFVMFFACYGQFESGLSAFALEVSGISPAMLGVALAANTAVIVLAQFLVLRLVERRRRSRVIAAVGLVWAVAWLLAAASGWVAGGPAMATAAIISTYALFGLGEAMLSPTVAPLVADLAPASMLGQYNATFALVKQLALALGPAVGGLLAGVGAYGVYISGLVVCSLGISAVALRLGRRLTPVQDLPALAASRVVAGGGPVDSAASVRTAEARV